MLFFYINPYTLFLLQSILSTFLLKISFLFFFFNYFCVTTKRLLLNQTGSQGQPVRIMLRDLNYCLYVRFNYFSSVFYLFQFSCKLIYEL